MSAYKKLLFFALFVVFLGTAMFILFFQRKNQYKAINAVIDNSGRYIAGIASKKNWKDYKLFVYDLEEKKIKIRKIKFERDRATMMWELVGLQGRPAFSEDSSKIYWLHQNKKYGETYKLLTWNFGKDTLTETLQENRKVARFQIIPSLKSFVCWDYDENIHIASILSQKAYKHQIRGMLAAPNGEFVAVWGEDWPWDKHGEKQSIKVWQIENNSARIAHTITLDDFFAEITDIHVQFSSDSRMLYIFANRSLSHSRHYKDVPSYCRGYQFDTQNWNQINQYSFDRKLVRLYNSVVNKTGEKLLLAEYEKYPRMALKEIAFEENGQLIRNYYSTKPAFENFVAGHFYGRNDLVHMVTSKNEIISADQMKENPEIVHLNLNNDIPHSVISFIVIASGILIIYLKEVRSNRTVITPGILKGIVIIYAISFSIVGLTQQFAAASSSFYWFKLWHAGGFLLLLTIPFRKFIKIKSLSWIIASILLFIPTATVFYFLSHGE